jgi:uncharacterized protein
VELKIERGNMEKALIANELYQADSIVFINHFKGHMFSGFGGAMKNISMGCATRDGKEAMHSRIKPRIKPGVCKACGECVKLCLSSALALVDGRISLDADKCRGCGVCVHHCKRKVLYVQWSECMDNFQQNLCDYCYAVVKNKKLTCITFLNHVTKECDCVGTPQKPYMDNIGILAGDDPLAVDQASVDMINREFGSDFCRHIFPHIDYTTQLAYAEKIGIGTRKYVIINV